MTEERNLWDQNQWDQWEGSVLYEGERMLVRDEWDVLVVTSALYQLMEAHVSSYQRYGFDNIELEGTVQDLDTVVSWLRWVITIPQKDFPPTKWERRCYDLARNALHQYDEMRDGRLSLFYAESDP